MNQEIHCYIWSIFSYDSISNKRRSIPCDTAMNFGELTLATAFLLRHRE